MNAHVHEFVRPAVVQIISLFVAVGSAAEDRQADLLAVEVEAVEAVVGDV